MVVFSSIRELAIYRSLKIGKCHFNNLKNKVFFTLCSSNQSPDLKGIKTIVAFTVIEAMLLFQPKP